MKIAIIGTTGMAGQAIYLEAVKRGHDVTAIVRDGKKAQTILGASTQLLTKDIFDLTSDDLANFDVVVNAFANHQASYLNLDALTHLLHLFRQSAKRIIFILGAASLQLNPNEILFDRLKQVPDNAAWIDEPRYGVLELDILRATPDVNWTGVSPQQDFIPGPASAYKTSDDSIIFGRDGKSHVTAGNMALGILDEIETPQHLRRRFTISD
ncbi:NAD(P)H-binding protein [Weissella diestrammenae]|uniref:NAD(P)H-binding protein n=1 Tax=Weissella diestrammenae TaxID=1162633 RepID=A0A7G9T3Z1_9LACO|nr:NAD(P)H-binding protein [Weissella diestrammenae]MCM0583012.1 NAD(P)H-binding protein [Weissella diestrammenae]QNN74816.1 NAD(P)H-binding protein [Weissella diestrammenae]